MVLASVLGLSIVVAFRSYFRSVRAVGTEASTHKLRYGSQHVLSMWPFGCLWKYACLRS